MPAHESTRPVTPIRCDRIQQLADPDFLAQVVGPIASVEEIAMGTPGFSGSTHARLHVDLDTGERVSLVLKRTTLDTDWVAYRSGDRLGREAMLLSTAELAGVWDVYASPYVAYAIEPGATGLLMHDLAPYLFPDVREPINLAAEDALLSCLARLHARYWEAPVLGLPWLARPAHALSIVGPIAVGNDPSPPIRSPMRERVLEGWTEAFRRLPARTADLLRRPPEEHESKFAHLPRTLIHGDAKVANFGLVPGGRVAGFDWAGLGAAPVAVELGWYLAVNASRLARSKDAVIDRYRGLLEQARGERIADSAWREMVAAAVLAGAVMLLWSKALALRDGRKGAREEWEWWVDRLPAD